MRLAIAIVSIASACRADDGQERATCGDGICHRDLGESSAKCPHDRGEIDAPIVFYYRCVLPGTTTADASVASYWVDLNLELEQ